MGQLQHSDEEGVAARGRRLGWRNCLRKGCGRRYQARQWNQRYCQDPECLRLVHRWQAVKRQRERRASPEVRKKHAETERVRRQQGPGQNSSSADGDLALILTASPTGAWSRSKQSFPHVLCDRPGCYEPPRHSHRTPSAYCSDACRTAMRQVRDRERKYLARKTKAGQLKRRLEYLAAARKQLLLPPANQSTSRSSQETAGDEARTAVGGYGQAGLSDVTFRQSSGVAGHDSQAGSDSQPRAPPADGRVVVD